MVGSQIQHAFPDRRSCTKRHCHSEFKQLLYDAGRYTMIGTTTSFRQELEKIVSAKLTRRRQQTGFSGYYYDDSEDSDDPVVWGNSDGDSDIDT